MDSVKYILGLPENIDGIDIYPIRVKDHDDFMLYADVLIYSKERFINRLAQENEEFVNTLEGVELLDLLFEFNSEENLIINSLETVLSHAFRKPVSYYCEQGFFGFKVDEGLFVEKHNYDEIRKTILKQNLIFEPKIYKNKLVEEWAMLALQKRQMNSLKITIEDVLTTVSVFSGKSYEELANQSIYQLYADYKRINMIKDYETGISFRCAGEDVPVKHFSEEINMFKDPFDDLFVEKGKQLEKLNGIFNNK